MSKVVEMVGKVFGRLTILRRDKGVKRGHARWICRCACGTIKSVDGVFIRNGQVRSCGCLRKDGPGTRAGAAHYKWKGGHKNPGSIAWAGAKLCGLRCIAKRLKQADIIGGPTDVVRLYEKASGSCDICGGEDSQLYLDHCHKTGELRGFLCIHCNNLIGAAGDNSTILNRAVQYLDNHHKKD